MDFEIRKDRKPGGGRLTRERAAYFQLMEQGYSTREAARIVGINLRTGKRWRNGHHLPGAGKKSVPPIYPDPGSGPTEAARGGDAAVAQVSGPEGFGDDDL